MRYQLQRTGKPADYLLPEEEQVAIALRAYTFDHEQASVTDFTPTRVMYETYLRFVDQADNGADAPEVLNEKQFGAALRRAFNIGDQRHTRRRIGDQRINGYLFVRGPGSIAVHNGPGNPNLARHSADCQRMPVRLAC